MVGLVELGKAGIMLGGVEGEEGGGLISPPQTVPVQPGKMLVREVMMAGMVEMVQMERLKLAVTVVVAVVAMMMAMAVMVGMVDQAGH